MSIDFDLFTDDVKKVFQFAEEEAKGLCHRYVGTGHILLGLAKLDDNMASSIVLSNLGVKLEDIVNEVEKLVVKSPENFPAPTKLPQTPRAKKVIGYAVDEGDRLGHRYVGTEHILLGLIREEQGVAAQVFLNLGVELFDVVNEYHKLIELEYVEHQKKCRDEFSSSLRKSVLTFSDLQSEVGKWFKKNFPNGKPYHPLLGLSEEVGELCHAHLKMEQGIRTDENQADAVGCIVIYLADYCNRNGISLSNAVMTTWNEVRKRDWQKNKIDGKNEIEGLMEEIRPLIDGKSGVHLGVYKQTAKKICEVLGWNFEGE